MENSDEAIDAIKNTVKNSDGATDAVKSTAKNSGDSVQYIDERFVGSREFTDEELELLTTGNEVVEDVTKKVPNPYGKKGGPEHQAVTQSIIEGKPAKSYKQEFKIVTENGDKNYRYADVVEFDKNGGVSKIHQVGKVNKNGTPISREKTAINDIKETKKYKNTPVYFWPYNSDTGPIIF